MRGQSKLWPLETAGYSPARGISPGTSATWSNIRIGLPYSATALGGLAIGRFTAPEGLYPQTAACWMNCWLPAASRSRVERLRTVTRYLRQ